MASDSGRYRRTPPQHAMAPSRAPRPPVPAVSTSSLRFEHPLLHGGDILAPGAQVTAQARLEAHRGGTEQARKLLGGGQQPGLLDGGIGGKGGGAQRRRRARR